MKYKNKIILAAVLLQVIVIGVLLGTSKIQDMTISKGKI